jgi:O-antigen/teichoic acid export membrane protein
MFGRLFRFGSQLQVSRFAEVVQTQFDKLVIARFLGLSLVGMYEFGSRPLARLRAFPMAAMAGLLPAMAALDSENNQERILAGVVRSTRYIVAIGLPVFTFVAVFAQPVVLVWLGEGFALAGTALQVLAAGYLGAVVVAPLALAAQGRGEPRYQMQATLVQALLNIALSIALVYYFGYAGAAAGTCVASIAGALLFIRLYGHRLMEDVPDRCWRLPPPPRRGWVWVPSWKCGWRLRPEQMSCWAS